MLPRAVSSGTKAGMKAFLWIFFLACWAGGVTMHDIMGEGRGFLSRGGGLPYQRPFTGQILECLFCRCGHGDDDTQVSGTR